MKRWAVVVATLFVFVASIAILAPATLVDDQIASRANGNLRVGDAQGTIWRGRGVLAPPDGRWRIPLSWRLGPLPLLRQELDVDLIAEPGDRSPRGRIQLAAERVTIGNLDANIPAQLLRALPGSERLGIGGEIAVRTDGLTLARNGSTGGATAEWRNARLVPPGMPAIELGSVTAALTVRGNALAGPVTSRGGQVAVSGNLSLDAGQVSVDLRLEPTPGATARTRESVAALGPPDPSGAVLLRVQRSFR